MTALLVIKAGDAIPAISAKRRDFETWIAAGAGLSLADVKVVRVFRGETLPEPESVPGVIITGSSFQRDRPRAVEREHRALGGTRDSARQADPGHLLRASTDGARARRAKSEEQPARPEIGTTDVRMTAGCHAVMRCSAVCPRRCTCR